MVLFFSQLIEHLPMATLSAVLIYIAIKIFRVDQMRATAQYSWRAFALMLIALLGTVVLGIVYGVLFAVVVSFVYQASRSARPELLRLGRSAKGTWLPLDDRRAVAVPGIAAFALNGPLWFGNANWFRMQLIDVLPAEDEDDGDGDEESEGRPELLVRRATDRRCRLHRFRGTVRCGRDRRPARYPVPRRRPEGPSRACVQGRRVLRSCSAGRVSSTRFRWRSRPTLISRRTRICRLRRTPAIHPPKHETFDLVARTNTDPGSRPGGGRVPRAALGLYMARATPGRVQLHYLQSWLLPSLGLRASIFHFNTGYERDQDYYLDVGHITVGADRWQTEDHYVDLVVRTAAAPNWTDLDELLLKRPGWDCSAPRPPRPRCAAPSSPSTDQPPTATI